jgi:hypothetical protein
MPTSIQLGWLLAVPTLVVYAGLASHLLSHPELRAAGTLDIAGFWSLDDARALLDGLSPASRAAYLGMYLRPLGDLALPCCYAPMFALFLRGLQPGRPWLAAVALLSGVADLLENWSVVTLLRAWPDLDAAPPFAATGGPFFSLVKWACLATALVAVFVSLVKGLVKGSEGRGAPVTKRA